MRPSWYLFINLKSKTEETQALSESIGIGLNIVSTDFHLLHSKALVLTLEKIVTQ